MASHAHEAAEAEVKMILLDTDVFSLLELPVSAEYRLLRSRIAQLDPQEPVAITVITYEEQSRGRLACVNAARSARELVDAYTHLRQHIANYRKIPIVEFDDAAAKIATTLQKSKLRLGTMDIRIGAIALAIDALLITRNLRHFERI